MEKVLLFGAVACVLSTFYAEGMDGPFGDGQVSRFSSPGVPNMFELGLPDEQFGERFFFGDSLGLPIPNFSPAQSPEPVNTTFLAVQPQPSTTLFSVDFPSCPSLQTSEVLPESLVSADGSAPAQEQTLIDSTQPRTSDEGSSSSESEESSSSGSEGSSSSESEQSSSSESEESNDERVSLPVKKKPRILKEQTADARSSRASASVATASGQQTSESGTVPFKVRPRRSAKSVRTILWSRPAEPTSLAQSSNSSPEQAAVASAHVQCLKEDKALAEVLDLQERIYYVLSPYRKFKTLAPYVLYTKKAPDIFSLRENITLIRFSSRSDIAHIGDDIIKKLDSFDAQLGLILGKVGNLKLPVAQSSNPSPEQAAVASAHVQCLKEDKALAKVLNLQEQIYRVLSHYKGFKTLAPYVLFTKKAPDIFSLRENITLLTKSINSIRLSRPGDIAHRDDDIKKLDSFNAQLGLAFKKWGNLGLPVDLTSKALKPEAI